MKNIFVFLYTATLLRVGYGLKRAKQRAIKGLLFNRYRHFIESYRFENEPAQTKDDALFPVWVCWWQGEENMPKMVQMCYRSLRDNANGHPVHLITKENYKDYVTFPDHILRKFNAGVISITHLSDILRVSLIYEYGGMWIDATILLTAPLPLKIDYRVFSIKHAKRKPHISNYRWTTFFWYGERGNILFHFVRAFYYAYWEKENKVIDYLLMDYIFAIAYDSVPAIALIIDSIPFNNPRHNDLRYQFKANAVFDLSRYNEICSDTYLHKLSWKMKPEEYAVNGEPTFYGYLIQAFDAPEGRRNAIW